MISLLGLAVLLVAPFSVAVPQIRTVSDNSCCCGYKLSKHGDLYYPLSHTVDFSNEPDLTVTSLHGLKKYGLNITHNVGVGGSYMDVQPLGKYQNVRIKNGALELKVPGGQKLSTGLTAAEVTFGTQFKGLTGGVFTVGAKIDGTTGTCQAIFTYHDVADKGVVQDEQDIEILGKAINMTAADGTPPGIELTNFDPSDPNNAKNDYTIIPFPSDPTIAYHNYTIDWRKNKRLTFFDDISLRSPKNYTSINPSDLYINHWSDGDPMFTAGPPTKDVILRVKTLQFYYKTASDFALPKGCSKKDVCVV